MKPLQSASLMVTRRGRRDIFVIHSTPYYIFLLPSILCFLLLLYSHPSSPFPVSFHPLQITVRKTKVRSNIQFCSQKKEMEERATLFFLSPPSLLRYPCKRLASASQLHISSSFRDPISPSPTFSFLPRISSLFHSYTFHAANDGNQREEWRSGEEKNKKLEKWKCGEKK